MRVSYPIVRLSYQVFRLSYRKNRLSSFAFIVYQVLRFYRVNLNTSAFLLTNKRKIQRSIVIFVELLNIADFICRNDMYLLF